MKKIFTLFIAMLTMLACGTTTKVTTQQNIIEKTTTSKTTIIEEIIQEETQKGAFKIGFVSSNKLRGANFKSTLNAYTQDVVNKSQVGEEFLKLPSGLFINSSKQYNLYTGDLSQYIRQTTSTQQLFYVVKSNTIIVGRRENTIRR